MTLQPSKGAAGDSAAGSPALIVRRVAGFGLTTLDAERLTQFYEQALGCQCLAKGRREGADFERLMGVDGGAQRILLGLGNETIELLQFDRPGDPYPSDRSPMSPAFQHFALIVGAMDFAIERLAGTTGWTPISTGGPQLLPAASGGVTAFKFRDPDGHPLEFLAFPTDRIPDDWRRRVGSAVVCGIDHSALSVVDTERSLNFYQFLGLRVTGHSVNHGMAQERLDGVANPWVDVTSLAPTIATPHVELLGYRTEAPRRPVAFRSNDVAATRLILDTRPAASAAAVSSGANAGADEMIVDPDGHRLQLMLERRRTPAA